MPARANHTREWEFAALWDVEIGRYQEIRPAFKNNLLDPISIAFDDSRDARVERRLFRPWTETLSNFLPNIAHIGQRICPRLQCGATFIGLFLDRPNELDQVVLHHVWKPVERSQWRGLD